MHYDTNRYGSLEEAEHSLCIHMGRLDLDDISDFFLAGKRISEKSIPLLGEIPQERKTTVVEVK
jgi:hypothetical protein